MNKEDEKIVWWIEGLLFGLFMFISMGIIYPWLVGEELVLKKLLLTFVIFEITGLGFPITRDFFNRLLSSKKQ